MLFSGWESPFHTLVVGVLAYVTLMVFLPFSGKRTLSKMNAFDLVVTIALGSTLATVVHAVVLETDGSFSIVRPGTGAANSSLVGVDGPQALRERIAR